MKTKLRISSPTLAELEQAITKHYYGTVYKVVMGAANGFVRRVSDGKILEGFTVRIKKGRYRLEEVQS